MKTRSLDAVLASQPLNATAGRVVSQKGEHYEPPKKNITPTHSELPLPVQPVSVLSEPARNTLFEMMTRPFGRLTVIGVHDNPERNKSRKAAYVVRCVCGRYETRRRRSLLVNPNIQDKEDRCSACWALVLVKKRYGRRGGRALEDFTHRGQRL